MTKLDRKQPHGMPSWADLMTDDPEAARAFYGALFGWTFDIGGPESGHYTMCKTGAHNAAGLGRRGTGSRHCAAARAPHGW
jgi:predicted enzyme related to lactoylglutathione lyase